MKRYFLILILLFFTLMSEAQTVLSLDDCRKMAIDNNIKTQTKQLEIQSARETKKSAFTGYFPQVSASLNGFYVNDYLINSDNMNMDGVNFNINPATPEAGMALQSLYAQYGALLDPANFEFDIKMLNKGVIGNAMLMQPLFAGGRIVNGNKLAELGVQSAEYQYEMAEREVLVSVEEYYWKIISLQEKMKTLKQSDLLIDTLYYKVEGSVRNDLALKNDVMKVKLKRDELRLNRRKLENGIELAKRALCQYIGLDYAENLILSDTLAIFDIKIDSLSILESDISTMPEYKLLDLSIQAEKFQKRMTIGESMPQVAVGAAYLYNDLMGKGANNVALLATLSIPISDWWKTSHDVKKQKIMMEIAEKNKIDIAQKLDLQLQQVWNEVTEAYEEADYWKNAIEESKENYRIVNDYYELQMNTISDLLEAETMLQQTNNQYIDSKINYLVKVWRYRKLVGK